MKTFKFDFIATERGYGVVCADTVEEAKAKIMNDEYEDIIDTFDMYITEILDIVEDA